VPPEILSVEKPGIVVAIDQECDGGRPRGGEATHKEHPSSDAATAQVRNAANQSKAAV
jgi:hypothetical protein